MNDSHVSGVGATDKKKTVAVDFDGVIYLGKWNGTNAPLEPGAVVPGTKEAIAALRKNYRVIIFTCRAYTGTTQFGDMAIGHPERVAEWLKNEGIEVDEVCTFPGKISADLYIDDKAIPFSGDWFGTLSHVFSFRHWMQK